jgi:hypothetical protein
VRKSEEGQTGSTSRPRNQALRMCLGGERAMARARSERGE